MENNNQISAWKEAEERSKIPRVNWKMILGKSLTMYLKDNKYTTDEELTKNILLMARVHINELKLQGWTMSKIANNLKISLSARRTEQRLYGDKK